jgi:putative oxidoreductase
MELMMNTQFYMNHFYQYQMSIKKFIEPVVLLGIRIYLFDVFFFAGLLKIQDWESTLLLFEYEYMVPLIPSHLAAYAGTATELILPILLVVGLFTTTSAIGLFIFNIVAVLSLEDIAQAALLLHVIWGILIFILFLWSAGKLSLDQLIHHKILKHQP